jgi:Fic family protein
VQPADFSKDKAGRLIKAPQGYWAFNPAPLPPSLTLTWELAGEISAADRALSELAGVARTLPNPHLLISPFIRREAVLSSRIEGTQASLSDLFFYEASQTTERHTADVQEVANYVHALEYGLARLADLPISTRLFREMHERLMEGVRGEHLTPGEFRRSQNWIGSPGCTLMDATFVPPPIQEMNAALGELERFLHSPSPLPPLVRLALVHYQFEAIHPFLDGNGRIGRLLLTLLFCTEGLLPQPLLYLSAYFERRRDQYYQGLLGVSRHGHWTEWITFFLRGVTLQARDALRRATLLLDLQKEYRDTLLTVRSTALTQQLMESLFSYPALTVAQATQRLGATTRTAQLTIEKLIDQTILKEATGRSRNRVYIAPQVIQIIEAQETE